ncbi:hypothetical protein MVEN_01627900 [Mycena venus]|uniref:Uncharacterized protein n=1 Tax=Mycena venus TaxID=2733690 RepID=A0A8H6XQI6_9AGAR|nr:hypothetical protein MVEN_01627900 [Mycena venus]
MGTSPSIGVDEQCRFPIDLEREIFETTALSQPSTIADLLLVAQRVKNWVEPFLYRVIFICGSKRMDGLPRFTPRFDTRSRGGDAILGACSGVTELFLSHGVSGDMTAVLEAMFNLRRLTVEIDPLFSGKPIDFAHPLFRHLTHLEILDSARDRATSQWMGVTSLPTITHLAFSDQAFCPIFSDILAKWAQLQCLVFLCNDPEQIAAARRLAEDPRFVASGTMDVYLDWQRGVRGGQDYWSRANAFIARKRAGKVEPFVYEMAPVDP